MPEPVLLLLGEVHVRFEDREVVLGGMPTEPLFPLTHLFTVPAYHTSVVDRKRGVRDHESFIDADDFTETLTLRTGPCGRVEGEHLVGGFLEGHAIRLEAGGEIVGDIRGLEHQAALAMTLEESGFGGIHEAGDGVFGIIDREAIDDEEGGWG